MAIAEQQLLAAAAAVHRHHLNIVIALQCVSTGVIIDRAFCPLCKQL